ncbi:putative receptor-like protein kinase At3g47110 [Rhododendron vialii]|uniref:putative receptor-like protein kinase At3g47110 n=1 Tax=Rhododendron vialii TaxID=182163 RepID=UPI00265D626C|nr:putative receptor-like protein kinase At3g47110 [Rhododendron vialii]
MCNGSLEQWLHSGHDKQNQANKSLKIIQRLNIAVDVASALEYLHHHCEVPIVHCDLKPSNVLLDYDMTAHVGDFGLARFLIQAANDLSNEQNLSVGLKGSVGYIAPENGMGAQVSTLGDVYSNGILLLEMFTGKRPTDDIFKDGLSICDFVSMGLLVLEILSVRFFEKGRGIY